MTTADLNTKIEAFEKWLAKRGTSLQCPLCDSLDYGVRGVTTPTIREDVEGLSEEQEIQVVCMECGNLQTFVSRFMPG